MKKRILFSTAVFLITLCFVLQPASAQEKTKEEKEKEAQIKQQIDMQKKAMMDQKKFEEMQKALKEAEADVEEADEALNHFYKRTRSTGSGRDVYVEPFVFTPGVEFSGGHTNYWLGTKGDSERTTWDFSKYVKESTFSKQYSFDVEKTVGTVVMTVMGDCKAGDIRVKILMPGGKTYSDIVIDEFGNLNWRKTFTISEEENKEKAGEWIFKIDAAKATGYFKISLQTY